MDPFSCPSTSRQRRRQQTRSGNVTRGRKPALASVGRIQQLEQKLYETTNEADILRQHRDELANALHQPPGGDHYFPRPPSPRRRRDTSVSLSNPGLVPASTKSVSGPVFKNASRVSAAAGQNGREENEQGIVRHSFSLKDMALKNVYA